MNVHQIETRLTDLVRRTYPAMKVSVAPWDQDPSRLAIHFVEPSFARLYSLQRYHALTHLIPDEFYEAHLADTVWFELAPGETPADVRYPDEEMIAEITPEVMSCLKASGFVEALDNLLYPADEDARRAGCHGDFTHARVVLMECGFEESEQFDVLHVLMAQGGYCDCEILYNVAETSRLAGDYWRARAADRKPYDPHEAR